MCTMRQAPRYVGSVLAAFLSISLWSDDVHDADEYHERYVAPHIIQMEVVDLKIVEKDNGTYYRELMVRMTTSAASKQYRFALSPAGSAELLDIKQVRNASLLARIFGSAFIKRTFRVGEIYISECKVVVRSWMYQPWRDDEEIVYIPCAVTLQQRHVDHF